MRSKSIKYPNEQQTQLYDRITKLQTKILDKLSTLKKNKKHLECKHLQTLSQKCQQYHEQLNYYDKFWKTFLINEVSHNKVQQLEEYLIDYDKRINDIENLFTKHQELSVLHSRRKSRRPAGQIQKQSQCPYPRCFKIYGSEVSLNLHIKLKHNGGNKTDRQKAAELIWQARQKGKSIPQFYINLPPNFVEEYGVMTKRLEKTQEIGQMRQDN